MANSGFDHGVGHPLLLLYDAKAPHCRQNKAFKSLGHYAESPKVADAVLKAQTPFFEGYAIIPPVSSTGPETHAKHLALSYAGDVLRVFPQISQSYLDDSLFPTLTEGMLWNVDTGTRSGTLFACNIAVFEVQEPRASIVRFRYLYPFA
jgi:hypothetical protein